MTSEMAVAYRRRWNRLVELEIQEQRAATVASRWQQLAAILSFRPFLPYSDTNSDEELVHLRWQRLKEIHERYVKAQIGDRATKQQYLTCSLSE